MTWPVEMLRRNVPGADAYSSMGNMMHHDRYTAY